MKVRAHFGFTLIELMMVMLIVAILAAVALPDFFNFTTEAKNAATKGALGGMRAAIEVARVAIALRETISAPRYPSYTEMSGNLYNATHPKLSGNYILDPSAGIPVNPWTDNSAPLTTRNKIFDCSGLSKGGLLALPNENRGWCYSTVTGQIWANSSLNQDPGGITENEY